jgi:hypothetical protein
LSELQTYKKKTVGKPRNKATAHTKNNFYQVFILHLNCCVVGLKLVSFASPFTTAVLSNLLLVMMMTTTTTAMVTVNLQIENLSFVVCCMLFLITIPFGVENKMNFN